MVSGVKEEGEEGDFEFVKPEHIPGITLTGGRRMIQQTLTGNRKVGAILPAIKRDDVRDTRISKVNKLERRIKVTYIPDLRSPEPQDFPEGFACYVRGPYISFTQSDSRAPPSRSYSDTLVPPEVFADGTVNFYYRLPWDSGALLLWKQKIGTWLAKNVLKLDDAVAGRRLYYITDFPDNYILFQQRKGRKEDPRRDAYLEATGKVKRFRSPHEFFEHAAWLIKKKPENGLRAVCSCKYCTASK